MRSSFRPQAAWKLAAFSVVPVLVLAVSTELLFRARFRSANFIDNLSGANGELVSRTNAAGYYWLGSDRRPYVRSRKITRSQTSEQSEESGELVRIAVIGGSSAAGYPYEAQLAFPNMLRVMLESLYPGVEFQVLNLAYFAQTYHFGREVFRDISSLRPRFLLIYSGHNEHYPHNLAQLIARRERSEGKRAIDAMAETLGAHSRAIGWALDHRRQRDYVAPPELEVATYLEDVVENYATITDEIARAARLEGTRVLLGTPARNLADFPPEAYTTTRDAAFSPLDPAEFALLDSAQKEDPRNLYRLGRWHHLHGELALARGRYVQASDRVLRLGRVHSKIQDWIKGAQGHVDNVDVVDTEGFVESSAGVPILGDHEILDWVHPHLATHYLIALAYLQAMRPILDSELGATMRDVPALAELEPLLANDFEASKANGLIEAGFVNLRVGRPDLAFTLLRRGLETGPSHNVEVKGALALALLSLRHDDLQIAQSIVDVVKVEAHPDLVAAALFDFRDLEGADELRSMFE